MSFLLSTENSSEELKREREEKKRYLLRKLSFRPTVEELKTRKVREFLRHATQKEYKCFSPDHQIQRLHRGDPLPRVRPTGGQALDTADPQGQGLHQEGAQRLQVQRDGRARGEQTPH